MCTKEMYFCLIIPMLSGQIENMTNATNLSRQSQASSTTLVRIASPLTRIGYGITRQNATLLTIHAGAVSVIGHEPGMPPMETFGPRLVWLPPGDAVEVKAAAGTRGDLLAIRDTTIIQSLPDSPLGGQIRRALEQRIALPLEDSLPITQTLEGIAREQAEAPAGSDLAQSLYLGLLLLQVWRLLRANLIVHGRAPQGLAERFIALTGQHLRDHWPVGRYAAILGVSRNRLGTAVRRATGFSPQNFLHEGLLREGKELLANTGMPVGQVAFRLGFPDPAYFNRFFSRKTGISPGQFRREMRKRGSLGDMSYAAWP
ncbi:MAG: helix-turn-helix domain-containing protein [Novosphingobium sp.]|nr:helix-turn-helix domain-containing protein [Novosphingobium sp.]